MMSICGNCDLEVDYTMMDHELGMCFECKDMGELMKPDYIIKCNDCQITMVTDNKNLKWKCPRCKKVFPNEG